MFFEYAKEAGAISAEESEKLRVESWQALQGAADAQAQHVLAAEPTALFFALLRSAIAAGGAHVADKVGECPDRKVAIALGWEQRMFGIGENEREEWVHKGSRVGWIDGQDLYLDLSAAYKAAQGLAGETERLTITGRTLAKRLWEKGYLVSRDVERGKNTVRRTLQGARHDVLHVRAAVLLEGAGPVARKEGPSADQEVAADSGSSSGGADRPDTDTDGEGEWGEV